MDFTEKINTPRCRRDAEEHYMVDALKRQGEEALGLIRRGDYWALHAARQSGKTTLLMALVDKINAEGDLYALYCSLEFVVEAAEPENGIPAVIACLFKALEDSKLPNQDSFARMFANIFA